MYQCKFCNKECKNTMSLVKHEQYCILNENRLIANIINVKNFGHKGHNQFTKAEKLGIDKPIRTVETRIKIATKKLGKTASVETKNKIKTAMQLAVKKYPKSYSASNISGRTKSFNYIDSFGNSTKLKGNWELLVAKFFEKNEIKWTNLIEGFEYDWNGSKHIYYPDFYLPDLDIYIEVKGYQRDRDLAKWKVIKNLVVIRYGEINQIKDNTFCLGPLAQLVEHFPHKE
jgi:hypothetical protein